MTDFLNEFIQESEEDLTKLNNDLLDLESDPDDTEAMDSIFRVAHTLKGNFGAMGFGDASTLAHSIEDLLDEMRQGRIEVTPERMDLIFEGVDKLDDMLAEIAADGEPSSTAGSVGERIRRIVDGEEDVATDDASAADGDGSTGADEDSPPEDDAADATEGDEDSAEEDDADESDAESVAVADYVPADVLDDPEEPVFHVEVEMADVEMKGVDALFFLKSVEETVDVVGTHPSREDIEDGDYDEGFDVVVTGSTDADALEGRLSASSKVESIAAARIAGDDPDEAGQSGGGSAGTDASSDEDRDDGEESGDDDSAGQRSNGEVESIRVDVDQIDDLYNQIEELVTSRIKLRHIVEGNDVDDAEDELNELDKITSRLQDTVLEVRLVPLQKIVGNLPRLVRDLARSQDKEIDLEMHGTDIELDRSILNEMRDPLMHLIRNAVDHGIEPPDVREANGKDPAGTITLRAKRERDRVTIVVSDDGKGLDVEAIRDKAVQKEVLPRSEAEVLEESEVYELIFHPGFSTADEVTDVSGRGVGMDVVRDVVNRVDGSIDVHSELGEGTTITMTLPVTVAIVKVLFVRSGDEQYGIPIKNIAEISRFENVNRQQIENSDVITSNDTVYPIIRLGEALDVPGQTKNGDGMIVRIKDSVRRAAIHCDAVIGQEEVVIKPFEGIVSGIPGISGASILGEGEVVMILDVETL